MDGVRFIKRVRNFWELYEANNYQPLSFHIKGSVQDLINKNLIPLIGEFNNLQTLKREFDEIDVRNLSIDEQESVIKRIKTEVDTLMLNIVPKNDLSYKTEKSLSALSAFRLNPSATVAAAINEQIEETKSRYKNKAISGIVSFDICKNDGLFVIGTDAYEFTTMWTVAGLDSVHCYKDRIKAIGYNSDVRDFPQLYNIVRQFDFTQRCRTLTAGDVVILQNSNDKFAAMKVEKIESIDVSKEVIVTINYSIYNV